MQTPRLLRSALAGYAARVIADHQSRLAQAWHTAVLYRVTEIPSLADILGHEREPQTPEQMAAAMDAWVVATAEGA